MSGFSETAQWAIIIVNLAFLAVVYFRPKR